MTNKLPPLKVQLPSYISEEEAAWNRSASVEILYSINKSRQEFINNNYIWRHATSATRTHLTWPERTPFTSRIVSLILADAIWDKMVEADFDKLLKVMRELDVKGSYSMENLFYIICKLVRATFDDRILDEVLELVDPDLLKSACLIMGDLLLFIRDTAVWEKNRVTISVLTKAEVKELAGRARQHSSLIKRTDVTDKNGEPRPLRYLKDLFPSHLLLDLLLSPLSKLAI